MDNGNSGSGIDVAKTLERMKQETGLNWWDGTYGSQRAEFICAADGVTRRLRERHDGTWTWRHETDIAKHRDHDWNISADIAGTSPTFDEALAALMEFTPLPPILVDGVAWHGGSGSIAACASGESNLAVIDGEVATVLTSEGGFTWKRDGKLLDSLRATGLAVGTDMNGCADTFEGAARAAISAPEKLRADLKAWLALGEPKQKELAPGAAGAFLDACCGFEAIGPVSPVVRAHILAAIGSDTPRQFYPPHQPANAKRIVAFAEHLEALAAQLRTEVGEV